MDMLTIVTMFGTACAALEQAGHSVEEIALLAGDVPVEVVEKVIADVELGAYEAAQSVWAD